MKKEMICTVCPIGCRITVEGDAAAGEVHSIEGYTCKRGVQYATDEFLHPVRILTTIVKTDRKDAPVLAVRSRTPLPKDKLMDCMEVIRKVQVKAPVERYQVIVPDICGTGVDIVASGKLEA